MMWPLWAERRAARFAAAVEGRQTTVGSLDADTAALVQLARRLEAVDQPSPRPEFAADLRLRLLDAAPVLLATPDPGGAFALPPRNVGGARRTRLGVAAVATAVVATIVGVGFASGSALPGDPLYPVKRTLESVEVATAGSTADQGRALLSQATTRLTEAQDLVRTEDDPAVSVLVTGTIGDFSSQATDGGTDLVKAYRDDGDSQAIVDLRDFTKSSTSTLEQMSTQLPATALTEVADAASDLTSLDSQAWTACPSCSDNVRLKLPPNLATLVSDRDAGLVPTLPGNGSDPDESSPPAGTTSTFPTPPTSADPSTLPTGSSAPETPSSTPPPESSSAPETTSAPTVGTTPPPSTLPSTTEPQTTDPTTTELETSTAPTSSSEPVTTDPGTSVPPPTSAPVTTDPGTSVQPPTSEPVTTDPPTSQSGTVMTSSSWDDAWWQHIG